MFSRFILRDKNQYETNPIFGFGATSRKWCISWLNRIENGMAYFFTSRPHDVITNNEVALSSYLFCSNLPNICKRLIFSLLISDQCTAGWCWQRRCWWLNMKGHIFSLLVADTYQVAHALTAARWSPWSWLDLIYSPYFIEHAITVWT